MGEMGALLLGFHIFILFNAANAANNAWTDKFHRIKNGQEIVLPVYQKPQTAISTQIIGGKQAPAGLFPWHAWLDISEIGSSGGYLCGASLIAPKYAMSACHCIESPTQYKHDIVLGTINMNSPTAGYVRKFIAQPICHESFNSDTIQNDVSLLPFDSPVTPTDNIKFINLPQPSVASTSLVGIKANVSGFGRTSDSTQAVSNTLKYATLTITPDSSCTTEYGSTTFFPDVMLCAKAAAADQADCNGDSGGALVYNNGTAWVQIGIVSWGGNSCLKTSSVYTRVTTFAGWVVDKMNALDGVPTTTSTTNTASTTTTVTTTKASTSKRTEPPKRSSTSKPPTTPKPPECAGKDFKSLQKCCSPPANDLLSKKPFNKTILNACKKFSDDTSIFNSYSINKQQNSKRNNSLNLTDAAGMGKQLGQAACTISCYLNQTGVINSTGAVDVGALTALLIANQDPAGPWVNNITAAVANCTTLISGLALPNWPTGKLSCNPTGALILQCVLGTIIDQCPSRVTTGSCTKDYALFDQCKIFITSAFMNGPPPTPPPAKKAKKP